MTHGKMRVLHINSNYICSSPHRAMVEHLADVGVENHVFVPVRSDLGGQTAAGDNVYVSPCFQKWDRLWFAHKQKKIIAAARTLLKDLPAMDCLHAYTLFTDGNCAMELSRETGTPYVVAVRNTDVNLFFKHMVHLRGRGVEILKNAAAVFFLSPVYRDHVLDRHVPQKAREAIRSKSFVIPNGIEDFWFDHLYHREVGSAGPRKGKRITVLHVGDIDANKNLLLTAEGIDILNRRGWDIQFRAVGKVREERIREKLAQYGFVSFSPPQLHEQLIYEYRQADVLAVPSHTETFGLVYAEAMSQGLPVIYTRGQGFDGQFPEGTVGYSVDSHNAEEMAENIVKVCERYDELSLNCADAVQRFRWDGIAREYRRIYETIGKEQP